VLLVDTNVWIEHLHKGEPRLVRLLEDDLVVMHPWIRGELALGSLASRERFLKLLDYLPALRPVKDQDVFALIESVRLAGRGIGWVDTGLLASCLAWPCKLWTRDARLATIARELGVAAGW
jgi:hypothetical protein